MARRSLPYEAEQYPAVSASASTAGQSENRTSKDKEKPMNPQDTYGSRVFSQKIMRQRLPEEVWNRLEGATHCASHPLLPRLLLSYLKFPYSAVQKDPLAS